MIPAMMVIGPLMVIGVVILVIMKKRKRKVVGADAFRNLMTEPGAATSSSPEIEKLRQNLRVKLLYQEDKVDAAIAFERERAPDASLEELIKAAIDRWERDNR